MAESIGSRKKFKSDSSSRLSNAISWQSWAEKYSLSPGNGIRDHTADVVKIFAKDVGLYGLSPRYEDVCLVVCKVCKQIYKMQALYGHYERRHAERLSQVLHQTMSSRKEYYGSSSSNTSLAHSSPIEAPLLDRFIAPVSSSLTHKAKPSDVLPNDLLGLDKRCHEKQKDKSKPAEKFNHLNEKASQGMSDSPRLATSNHFLSADADRTTPTSRPQVSMRISPSNPVSNGPKKSSAFHFPGFIAQKSMSNIFPQEKTSELGNTNSSRIISQTVSIKKTTLDSTSVYDFDDITVGKPSTDHSKSSVKNNRHKDHSSSDKADSKSTKSSTCGSNDKQLSISCSSASSKGFKTPDHTLFPIKNNNHSVTPSLSVTTESTSNDISVHSKKNNSLSKASPSSRPSRVNTSTPNCKASAEKTHKTTAASFEIISKVGTKKAHKDSSLHKSWSSSQVLTIEKLKYKKIGKSDSLFSTTLQDKEVMCSSIMKTKTKKKIEDLYSSSPSSMSPSSSRCSTPLVKKQEVKMSTALSSCSSPINSSKSAFSNAPSQVNQRLVQKPEKSKKLSEMSKRELLLNAKKYSKVKMSPKDENGLKENSLSFPGLSSDEYDETSIASFNRFSRSSKQEIFDNIFGNSNPSAPKDFKKVEKSRLANDSNSDSSNSSSERISSLKNFKSSATKVSLFSVKQKEMGSSKVHGRDEQKKFESICKSSPKVSADSFTSSGSRKRLASSEDDNDHSSLSGRGAKKQKTSNKTFSSKSHLHMETSSKKLLHSLNHHPPSPIGPTRRPQAVTKAHEVKIPPTLQSKHGSGKDEVEKLLLDDSGRNSITERRHQLQHGSRLHTFPSPSSSSEPIDSLDSPLPRTSAFQSTTTSGSKHRKKHITDRAEVASSFPPHASPLSYQPDIHCGVIVNSKFPCMNPLSCQEHSISLRRAVGGRSKAFDLLLLSQTSKPRHSSPCSQTIPTTSTSYSVLIPSPPPSYINPAASSNTSTSSSFSHAGNKVAALDSTLDRSRAKSKKSSVVRSLSSSSSSSSSISPPRQRSHNSVKNIDELHSLREVSPLYLSPKPDATEVKLSLKKVGSNPTEPEIKSETLPLDVSEQVHSSEMDPDEENKTLIEKLMKDADVGNLHDDEEFCDNNDEEIFGSALYGCCNHLLKPSLLEKISGKQFKKPNKLPVLMHKSGVVLLGSDNCDPNMNQGNTSNTATILDHHPRPIAVNTFGAWNLSTSSSAGLFAFNRRQDFLRQVFNKVVCKASMADSKSRPQFHQLWRRRSLNFPVRFNSCHLRQIVPTTEEFSDKTSSIEEELKEEEAEDDQEVGNHYVNFRHLAPPATFMKAFQSSHLKTSKSNQFPAAHKPSSGILPPQILTSAVNMNPAHIDDDPKIGGSHHVYPQKKVHLVVQPTESPNQSNVSTIVSSAGGFDDKLTSQTLSGQPGMAKSLPQKRRIVEGMPNVTQCTTFSVSYDTVSSYASVSISNITSPSHQCLPNTSHSGNQNFKAPLNISDSKSTLKIIGSCHLSKEEVHSGSLNSLIECKSKPVLNNAIEIQYDKSVIGPDPVYLTKFCHSVMNGVPKDSLSVKSNSFKTVLTPSKFQQNGFIPLSSSSSSAAQNMPPPSVVPNTSSVSFGTPPHAHLTDVHVSLAKSGLTSSKSPPLGAFQNTFNGISLQLSNCSHIDSITTCSFASSVLDKPFNSILSAGGIENINCREDEAALASQRENLANSSLTDLPSSPFISDLSCNPQDKKQNRHPQYLVNAPQNQHHSSKMSDYVVYTRHPPSTQHSQQLTNGVDSLGPSLNIINSSSNVQPMPPNFVQHNRHHIMNIIGTTKSIQNLNPQSLHHQQDQCQPAQDASIFHKNFSGGLSEQTMNYQGPGRDKLPPQDFNATDLNQIKQPGKIGQSSRSKKAMVGI